MGLGGKKKKTKSAKSANDAAEDGDEQRHSSHCPVVGVDVQKKKETAGHGVEKLGKDQFGLVTMGKTKKP